MFAHKIEMASAPQTEEIIVCRDLAKQYVMGDQIVEALKGVSFSIKRGDFVAVLGPSGSGKSTCMNMLGCLDTPSRGQLILDGGDVSQLNRDQLAAVRSTKIGFVFQQFNLLPRTSALDNVILPLLYSSVPKERHQELALRCLKRVNLDYRSDHHPSQLSGGQQQRVAIARALVNDPVLILADEPTGALDTRTSIEIMALFQELNNKGITIVLVTHEPEIAAAAKRHLYFRDGELQDDITNPEPRDMIAEARALAEADS